MFLTKNLHAGVQHNQNPTRNFEMTIKLSDADHDRLTVLICDRSRRNRRVVFNGSVSVIIGDSQSVALGRMASSRTGDTGCCGCKRATMRSRSAVQPTAKLSLIADRTRCNDVSKGSHGLHTADLPGGKGVQYGMKFKKSLELENLTPADRVLVDQCALLALRARQMRDDILLGEKPVSDEDLVRCSNASIRAMAAIDRRKDRAASDAKPQTFEERMKAREQTARKEFDENDF